MAAINNDNNKSHIALAQLPRRLRERYPHPGPQVTHQQLYRGALNALFPAEQHRGRWFVADKDLRQVAEAFDLTPKNTKAA